MGKASLFALAISGSVVNNKQIEIEGSDGKNFFSVDGWAKDLPLKGGEELSHFETGDYAVTYGRRAESVACTKLQRLGVLTEAQEERKKVACKAKVPTVHITFKKFDVSIKINRWKRLNAQFDLGGQLSGGQSGHCGNFNGDKTDDKAMVGVDPYDPSSKVGPGEELFHTFDLDEKEGNHCPSDKSFLVAQNEGELSQACAFKCAGGYPYFVTLIKDDNQQRCSCVEELKPFAASLREPCSITGGIWRSSMTTQRCAKLWCLSCCNGKMLVKLWCLFLM